MTRRWAGGSHPRVPRPRASSCRGAAGNGARAGSPAPAAGARDGHGRSGGQAVDRSRGRTSWSCPAANKSGSASAYRVPLGLPLVDATAPSRGPVLSDPYLPAVSAGGLDYVYQAPTRATIASSSKQVRIPLASQTFQAVHVPRGDARAGADRVPARARAQRRQAATAARARDHLRRRRAGRRRRDPDHRAGRRHRAAAGRRPGRQAGAPGRPEHQDDGRDHEGG